MKYGVIHKTGNASHIETRPEEDRTMAIGNMHKNLVKLGSVLIDLY